MSDVDRFQERLLAGDPEAAQQLADAMVNFWAAWFKQLYDAATVIAESGFAASIREALRAD